MAERETSREIREQKIKSIGVTLTPDELRELGERGELQGKRVVIVDVLRGTSTIITALANGAREVIPVATIEEAQGLKEKYGDDALLCGERGGKIVPGFDMGNSPREYTSERVNGKVVVLTTTNGVQAIRAAEGAQEIIIGSSLNAGATRKYLQKEGGNIILAASGTVLYPTKSEPEMKVHPGGKEDVLIGCGLIVQDLIQPETTLQQSWVGRVAEVARKYLDGGEQEIRKGLGESRWGTRMLQLDAEEGSDERKKDIGYIAENTNASNIVATVTEDGSIKIKEQYD